MSKKDIVETFFDAIANELDAFASGDIFKEVVKAAEPDVTPTTEEPSHERKRPDNTFTTVTPKKQASKPVAKQAAADVGGVEGATEGNAEGGNASSEEKSAKPGK